MSSLVHKLGVSPELGFHDVYSIDDPELLAFVPRPALALLLVFPVSNTYEKFRAQEDGDKPEYSGSGPDEPVIWYKQTIGNACGLIGLLHGVSNGPAKSFISKHTLAFAYHIADTYNDRGRVRSLNPYPTGSPIGSSRPCGSSV